MEASTNVEMIQAPAQPNNVSKKRSFEDHIKPQQIMHRFRAKSDFIKYFSESRKLRKLWSLISVVQLYLPPNNMVNKDFLKAVLADEK
jgi:hypothetical protein